jgi:predicted TIM-barrel fold metal-dependent hydrolase
VRFVLEHTGMPEQRDDPGFDRWRSGLRELATAENVAVKISGLGMLDHVWTVDTIRARVLTAIETFGVERAVFGSNWPVDGLYGDYGELIEAYRNLAAAFSRHEQELLLHGNAERIYRIPERHRSC